MAKEKVVTPLRQFYETFKAAVLALEKEHGPLYLAMVVQFAGEPEDEWILMVGSRSLAQDALEGTKIVAHKLSELVAPQVSRKVRRIAVIRESDPVFRAISQAISVDVGGLAEIERCLFDGLHVERAALFVSRPDAEKGGARRSKRRP